MLKHKGFLGKLKNQELPLEEKEKVLPKHGKKKKRLNQGVVAAGIAVIAASAFFALSYMKNASAASVKREVQNTAVVEKRDITSELSSSGTISPKDTYSITSLVEGEVIQADFEEGDQVTKGQILYQIDVSSMESELKSASNSLERAKSSYESAVEDYQEIVSTYSGNTYKSTETGYIKTLYIKAGDKISANTKIADIYNDQTMKLRVPFLSAEAAFLAPGNEGIVTLTDTLEQLPCVVTGVSSMEEALTGGRLVRYVTVTVANPGGLTASHSATVTIGEFTCSLEGSFEPEVDTVMSADISSNVEVESLLVMEGDFINKGTGIFRIDSKSVEKLVRTYQDSMDKAEESLESAQNKLDSTQDNYENYTITAPISGRVITKTTKAGDKVSKSSAGTAAMAVIYDLSTVTFEMSVDELDVNSVKVGQSVEVTADAIENKIFTGVVTNVSLESSSSNGVTNYPVTVTLDEVGDLLPGMNVNGRIILDEASGVLAIPVDALMRGNRVYIKDETVKEAQGSVPAGFRAVEVETGLVNEDYVEIVSGLSEGDEVYVAESSNKSGNAMSDMMPAGVGMPGQGQMPEGGGRQNQGGGQPGGRP